MDHAQYPGIPALLKDSADTRRVGVTAAESADARLRAPLPKNAGRLATEYNLPAHSRQTYSHGLEGQDSRQSISPSRSSTSRPWRRRGLAGVNRINWRRNLGNAAILLDFANRPDALTITFRQSLALAVSLRRLRDFDDRLQAFSLNIRRWETATPNLSAPTPVREKHQFLYFRFLLLCTHSPRDIPAKTHAGRKL